MDLPRLQIVSDLHLEFYEDGGMALLSAGLSWDQDAEALVLAGDIGAAGGGLGALEKAFRFLAGRFPRVMYVPGNHEFYGCEATAALEQLRALAAAIPNLTLLEPGVVADVGGRRVIGATLWFAETRSARVMERTLADFRAIGGFKPWVYEQNRAHVAWLTDAVREGDVVVTHHLPSPGSIAPRFANDPTNCYFLCNLSSTILNRRPALWAHGHTHESCDYELYRTRIVANPYGYPHELNPGHRALVVGGVSDQK